MKILITGANGYIGTHVINQLATTKHKICAVDFNFNQKISEVTYYNNDILSQASNSKLYNELGEPDAIIHLAWQDGFNHKAVSHLSNLPMHYLFIKNMIDSGCKSISIMGSMHEIGYYEGEINEDTPCNPMSLYGIAKNALRQAVMAYIEDKDVSLKWLRGFYITGDDIHNKSIFAKILEMAHQGQKTFPFTSGINKYDFIDIKEMARCIVAASIQNEISGIINICSGKPVSLKDKVEEFITKNNLDIQPQYGAYPSRKYDSPAIWGNHDKIMAIMAKERNNTESKE